MMPTSGSRYRWRLGELEIVRVLEFEAALFEPAVLYPDVTSEMIERHRSWLEPTLINPASGLMVFAFHSTVIKTQHATILVDTCSGNDKERPHKPRYHRKNWPYIANLAAAGFAPEDIDYVLCTHLHADHVGWNTLSSTALGADVSQCPLSVCAARVGALAECRIARQLHYRSVLSGQPAAKMESGQAQLVANDYAFDDSVRIEPWPGHTPGHVCVIARSSRASVILSGDIMHTALQCAEPQLNSCFCVDAEAARTTRQRFLETFADSPVMVIPWTFSDPDCRLDTLT